MLNFIRWNLYNRTMNIQHMAFITMIRHTLEYASSVWAPQVHNTIHSIEMGCRIVQIFGLKD